jgi:threonyl-tRNA synthetase
MLHRANLGTFDSNIGILIEHHAGALPVWLAPTQVAVLSIAEGQADYAATVAKTLQEQGVRVELDTRADKIGYKIRAHSLQKVPYLLVAGDKEKANGTVAVRARGSQDLGVMSVADFASRLRDDVAGRR